MKELVIIIWTVLVMVFSFLLMFALKKQKRQMGKLVMIYKIILVLICFGISFLVFYSLAESPHFVWASRLTIFVLGILNVWAMYSRPWPVRHRFKYEEDAFLIEFIFVTIGGLLCGIAFVSAPQVFYLIPFSVDVSITLWDIPLIFLLPFLILKLADFSAQVPFRTVENPWIFPLEPVNVEKWPWRDLMQINFQVKKSLLDEYHIFSWPANPWIEGPKEVNLGEIFRLVIQERRQRRELSTIQDMGDEYDGAPRFCWLFKIKKIWYKPSTWFRNPRFLNPDLSINQNKIQKGDVIIAKRIPGDGTKPQGINYQGMTGEDPDKTVIILR